VANEDRMTIDERLKYLRRMKKHYLKADRKERGHLLDEMEMVTDLRRKSLIRLMNSSLERTPRRKQRDRTYGPEVDDDLRLLAETMNHICAERLTPMLPWMAQHLARHGGMEVCPSLKAGLDQISISTVQRIMARIRQDEPRLTGTRPRTGNSVTHDILMRRIPWNEQEPGHLETDLVHHSDPATSSEFVCTIQMIDVATGWSERRAVLGRSYLVMKDAFLCILARLPFPVLEIHPDNGSELFNHHMRAFWKDSLGPFHITRSRPHKKDDNRFVEQKNFALVRAYLAYERLDTVDQTLALNHIYDKMWLYYNIFQPVVRVAEKTVIREEGRPTRVKRRYDRARTRFDRLCATQAIADEQQDCLHALRNRTNPRRLRNEINDLVAELFALPCAMPDITENAHHTLTYETGAVQDSCYSTLRLPTVLAPTQEPLKGEGQFR